MKRKIAAHKVADAHRAAARARSMPVAEVPDTPSTEGGPEQFVVASSTACHVIVPSVSLVGVNATPVGATSGLLGVSVSPPVPEF